MYAKWKRKLRCIDNQDVGSEAAIIKRVRNSSLVECLSAENVAGLSILPKQRIRSNTSGRGAFFTGRRNTERSSGR